MSTAEGLSIVIPHLNEESEIFETIRSIHETIDVNDFEIISIDDFSDKKYNIDSFGNIVKIRNDNRIGVDASRQKGVELAKYDNIAIFDGHMRWRKDNWASKMIESIKNEPNTMWCTTCLGLGYGTMDINNHKGEYSGADMLFINKNTRSDRQSREVLEPKWSNTRHSETIYEIPCVLGANYFFSKKWFEYINGLKGLQMWGTSEPFLSLKTWFAGGKCKIRTDIKIGHRFRDHAPYTTGISHLVYNKIFLAKTILPTDLENKLIIHIPNDINFKRAMSDINKDSAIIDEHRTYYDRIFKFSVYDYCKKFNIDLP